MKFLRTLFGNQKPVDKMISHYKLLRERLHVQSAFDVAVNRFMQTHPIARSVPRRRAKYLKRARQRLIKFIEADTTVYGSQFTA